MLVALPWLAAALDRSLSWGGPVGAMGSVPW